MRNVETWEFTDHGPEGRDEFVFRLEKHGTLLLLYEDNILKDTAFSTQKDLEVLEYFVNTGGNPFERKTIRDCIWPEKVRQYLRPGEVDDDYTILDQFLHRVRTLLNDRKPWRIIKSVRGKGLRFGGNDLKKGVASDPSTLSRMLVEEVESDQPARSVAITSTWQPPVPLQSPAEIPPWPPYQGKPAAYVLEEQGLVVGRGEEIELARRRWLSDRKRPLLIHGPPGIGKSTLAFAILHDPEVALRFGPRRFRLRCDEFLAVNELIARIGDKWFGLPAPVTEIQVTGKLSEGPAAVLLDNYETLLQGADRIAGQGWLAKLLGIEDLWLIVGIQGNDRPLGVNWAEPLEPRKLPLAVAREMFCRITGRATDPADSVLDGLLHDMDGVPHAIELLASQAIHYPDLTPLATLWNQERTALLRMGLGEARAENIEHAYEFVIRKLSGEALKLLRILSLLPAGLAWCDLENVLDGVAGLKAFGVLRAAALVAIEENRLRILSPLREYVFKAHPSDDAEFRPAMVHFLRLAAEGKRAGRRDGGGAVMRNLMLEYANIRWAVRAGIEAANPLAINAALGLARFSAMSGIGCPDSEGLLERARELAQQNENDEDEGNCLTALGDSAFLKCDYAAAKARCDEALLLYGL